MNRDSASGKPGRRDSGNRRPTRFKNPYYGSKHGNEGNKGKEYNKRKNFYNQQRSPSNNSHLLLLLIIVGIWIILAPLTFSYDINPVSPSGGRQLGLSFEQRALLMKWNDIVSGGILILFASLALTKKFKYALWVCCAVGVWLNAAPVVFWSPSAVSYVNDTFAGALVLAMCLLSNKLPGLKLSYKNKGSSVPDGWSYNPSSWNQRLLLSFGGLAGWFISRYLASYQMGYIDTVWDPFFGDSTVKVLDSSLSLSLPISDAGIGAFVYTFEFLLGWSGGDVRWKYFPWLVFCFGILVIPLSIAHVLLVLSQPVLVGYWCTLCLCAATVMLFLIPLGTDEIIAMGQLVRAQKKKGISAWKVFWHGAQEENDFVPERENRRDAPFIKSAFAGMSFPFTLIICVLIGLWITFSPAVFLPHFKSDSANIAYMAGLLVIVFAVIGMGEVLRRIRYVNILIGLALSVSVWFTDANVAFKINALVSGIALASLSIPLGEKKEKYGSWDKYIS